MMGQMLQLFISLKRQLKKKWLPLDIGADFLEEETNKTKEDAIPLVVI